MDPTFIFQITMYTFGFTLPVTAEGVLLLAISLVVLWIVVSIPVYISGELITDGRADFGSAMGATLGGAVFYVIVLWAGAFLLTPLLGSSALVISFILAILAWLAVYRASFNTSWLGALGIVFVGWLVLFVVDAILTSFFGVSFPKFYPF
jgi:hypothetical protein